MSNSPAKADIWEELKSLFKHGTIYSAGGVLGKAVGFLMIPFYTHYLSPADYGTLELLDLSVMLFGLVTTMWMNSSVIRYYYEYEDREHKNEVISTVLLTACLVGAVSATGGIVFAKHLSQLILKSPSFYKYFWVLSATFSFSSLNSVVFCYLRARQRSIWVASVDSLSLTLSLSLNIYFIAFLKLGVIGILYSSLITTCLSATTLAIVTFREVHLNFSPAKLRRLAAFGAPLVLTSIAAFALNFSDRFFLQHFTTVSIVGVYALGYKFGFMLSFLVVQPFDMIWSARMYEIANKENAGVLFSRILRYYCLLMVSVGLGISLIIKEIVRLVAPPAFHEAYKIVPVVLLAYVFQGTFRYLLSGLYITKKTAYVGAISCITLATNLLLNYALIPHYRGMGAAFATVLSFFVMASLTYLVSQRVYPIPYRLSSLFVPVGFAASIYLASTGLAISSLFLSVGVKTLLFLLFPVALYFVGFVSRGEMEQARDAAHSLWMHIGWSAAAAPGR